MEDLMLSTQQPPESSDGNLLLIDADGIAFLIGWNHRDHRDIPTTQKAVDTWFRDLTLLTAAERYLGILAPSTGKCFRYQHYRYKPYKGNRIQAGTEGNEWIEFWKPVICEHLKNAHGFVEAPNGLETDDVIAYLGSSLPQVDKPPIICSPDKDLKQIAGMHLDYRKVGQEDCQVEIVGDEDARYRWCMQMLTGDTTDNIAGVPGMGDKKAAELLKTAAANGTGFKVADWERAVKLAYLKYFGDYYGEIIYQETLKAVTMMGTQHPLWSEHKFEIDPYFAAIRTIRAYDTSVHFQAE